MREKVGEELILMGSEGGKYYIKIIVVDSVQCVPCFGIWEY